MNCKICSSESKEIFSAKILNKYAIKYYHCSKCDFLQTEEPFWLKEAYEAAIGITDTGILKRNHLFTKRSSAVIASFYNSNKKFLDFAGGYGIFVRMMRDLGFDFYWTDPFADNLFAKGFEHNKKDAILLITAFECFEHFVDPVAELKKMLEISGNIIFSTRLFRDLPPKPSDWWYYSLDSGQHISFYSTKTLRHLADKFSLFLNSDEKAYHMLSKEKNNNLWFKVIVKLGDLGLAKIFQAGPKSRTESDNELLSKKSGSI
jgi:hypothetical protein